MGVQRQEYLLEGLGCAHCASQIESEIAGLEGISSAAINFVTKTLYIETDGQSRELVQRLQAAAQKHEAGVRVLPARGAVQPRQEAAMGCTDGCCGDAGGKQQHHDDDGHDHGHSHDHGGEEGFKEQIGLVAGAVIFAAAVLVPLPFGWSLALYLMAYLLIGGEVLLRAGRNILRGRVFDENFLMSIATIGAFAIGEFAEGVAVMLFYQVGELFQDMAVNRSRKSIAALMDIRPDYANLMVDGQLRKVAPESVAPGAVIVVRPGEKIPLDGVVLEGSSALDTSALTGESLPRQVEPGSEVLSGSVNKSGLLNIRVTKVFGESTVAKILDLVQNAGSKKAHIENFITKFARYYTPAVVFAAAALAVIPPLVLPGAVFGEWLRRALVFLVVSCPCALVISIPLSFFGGIGGASRNGILVKGGNYLEALAQVDTVVFDKTGTLTQGVFQVAEVVGAEGVSQEELLRLAAHAEGYSNHPIAASIQKAYGKELDRGSIADYEEIAGQGLRITFEGRTVLAGNSKLMDQQGVAYQKPERPGTVVYLAEDGSWKGYILIADQMKEDSAGAIKALRELGVKQLVMLTGDNRRVAQSVGQELGIDKVYSELLPHQKVERLEEAERQKTTKGSLIFVGDGINDAPVLARADVGVAMGGVGSDAAIEAADVVLMTDEPSKLAAAIRIARRTRSIVWQNVIFALAVKGVILLLGAVGMATMWEAVFGDVGVALIAVLNAMRVMKPIE